MNKLKGAVMLIVAMIVGFVLTYVLMGCSRQLVKPNEAEGGSVYVLNDPLIGVEYFNPASKEQITKEEWEKWKADNDSE